MLNLVWSRHVDHLYEKRHKAALAIVLRRLSRLKRICFGSWLSCKILLAFRELLTFVTSVWQFPFSNFDPFSCNIFDRSAISVHMQIFLSNWLNFHLQKSVHQFGRSEPYFRGILQTEIYLRKKRMGCMRAIDLASQPMNTIFHEM